MFSCEKFSDYFPDFVHYTTETFRRGGTLYPYTQMISILILAVVGGWVGYLYLRDALLEGPNRQRRRDRVMARQAGVRAAPASPAAHEQLADALRDAEYLEDAIASYEKALDLERRSPTIQGVSALVSVGAEQKLRLTRLELSEKLRPEEHGLTLRTRQGICHLCGNLTMPDERNCPTCGSPLPVNTMWDTMRRSDMRKSILWEGTQLFIGITLVGIALYIASWMPILLRFTVMFATIIVLAWRFLKSVGPD